MSNEKPGRYESATRAANVLYEEMEARWAKGRDKKMIGRWLEEWRRKMGKAEEEADLADLIRLGIDLEPVLKCEHVNWRRKEFFFCE